AALTAPVPAPVPALLDTALLLAGSLAPAPWQSFPKDMIPATVTVGTKTVNAAEYLRAAALLLAQIANGSIPGGVTIQPASLQTDLYGLFAKIRHPKFVGVCWSLKPAKHK
ncbi:MAG TPA: hypothetical protein VN604_08500, partial [Nitrospirota bacterium]|nr:hypothetical protein [Nitrospirota bacterium]